MLMEDAALPSDQSQLEMIKEATGIAYLAGIDTTVASVTAFFLAMVVYPEVQAKAQAEVDRVVGHDRLPGIQDRLEMPYVAGVVNECLRWLPVVPIGEIGTLPDFVRCALRYT
jgi:cytochrome P450